MPMQRFVGSQGLDQALSPRLPNVVAIGNFDGVHLGHREILARAAEKAQSRAGHLMVYTFKPHPQIALRPEADLPLLSTYDERAELLEAAGVELLIEESFSRDFSTTTAEQFFSDILVGRLGAQEIVVGYDFAFGREREGSLESLTKLCQTSGVGLTIVPPHRPAAGEVVSSSKIRTELRAGRVDVANRLLGYEFFYRGVVLRGEGRGKQLGFSTANLSPQSMEGKLVLPLGVYATLASVKKSTGTERFLSVTNIGVRPTFTAERAGEFPVWIETHLLDATPDLYGLVLKVRFIQWIRAERKFPSIDALRSQILADCVTARKTLPSLT